MKESCLDRTLPSHLAEKVPLKKAEFLIYSQPLSLRGLTPPMHLARVNPLRVLVLHDTDAGTMLVSCDSERCEELGEVFSVPLNAGVDDAGTLFIADYILDAGVRITRFAPGAW